MVASLAKSYCSEAYFHAAAENIQIHGGIGFTWEHPAHLYFKRAKSSELMLGDPGRASRDRRRLPDRWGRRARLTSQARRRCRDLSSRQARVGSAVTRARRLDRVA